MVVTHQVWAGSDRRVWRLPDAPVRVGLDLGLVQWRRLVEFSNIGLRAREMRPHRSQTTQRLAKSAVKFGQCTNHTL